MPRTTAGYRYPFASTTARQHDHTMCKVIEAIAQRANAGEEEWGTKHQLPPVGDTVKAHSVRNRLFNARNCGQLADKYGPLSVSVHYLTDSGQHTNTRTPHATGFVLVVAVYTREQGRAAITSKVGRGERLAYNPWKE